MNRIQLFKTPQGWMTNWKGPHAAEVRRLFGTTILPTGFTDKAEPAEVLKAIIELNPGVEVFVGSDRRN